MSLKGLEQAEGKATAINRAVRSDLAKQKAMIKAEIQRLEFVLGDKQKMTAWRTASASSERIAELYAQMTEVEQLYLQAGNTQAARIFKTRTEKQLMQRLTNLKANQVEVNIQLEKFKASTSQKILGGLTDVRREAVLTEMYNQSRNAGGFLSSFGRAYLQDTVTLETKAAGSKTLGEYMRNLYNTYERGLKDVYVSGIVRGDTYDTMIQNLQKQTNITAGKAKILVNTEANAIFNDGVKKVIESNPLVKGYRFRAVLDSRTSKICQQHDGEFIPKDKIEPGVNYPPLHPNCRSTVTTVLVSEDEKKDTVQRYTKNGSNQWEAVPRGMNYQEYKDKFGFANSMNPKTYNPRTRDIHDVTLARIQPTIYTGYVKPSASSTKRIEKMVNAYIDNDVNYLNMLKENTGQDVVAKAMFRQAQAESGFDGLPLQLNSADFEKEVRKHDLTVVYRKFSGETAKQEFLTGTQPFGKGQYNYGAGTYVYESVPEDDRFGQNMMTIALKSSDSKILDLTDDALDSQATIAFAATPDSRINDILAKVSPEKRRDLIGTLAIEYGYDVMRVRKGTGSVENYMIIFNRTAAIVKEG